jgi:hypothetical protein
MVARTADDRWFCSDDASGRDPAIEIEDAGGDVQVWIGTFGFGEGGDVTLEAHRAPLAEVLPDAPDVFDPFTDEMGGSYSEGTYEGNDLAPDADAPEASVGTTTVSAGGAVYNPVGGFACAGFVSPTPSALVQGTGTLAFEASGAQDFTLLVLAPDGRWFCSDDHNGLDPGIEVSGAGDGTYTVWVGTFDDSGAGTDAVLTVHDGPLPSPEAR